MNGVICTGLLVTLVTVFSATHVAADSLFPYNIFDIFGMPVPHFPVINWYNGPNVCVDERNEPVGQDEFSDFSSNGRDVSENCKGNDVKYVCVSRISENGQATKKVTTYQCCPGFFRTTDGSAGCAQQK
ncbi:uncharacterized protein TNCT_106111 [Trichonephila clavata]|uniref:Uncharacterized protein n=1 Tax=Trichonephila clavata TaxID=2740835 RepID=A0A8X6KZQ5_TRICU|nr:uncharacterized protein TNCT_106111 [Trichonephila clavata]